MENPVACPYLKFEIGFKLQEQWINSQDPAAPQSNSSYLEIDRFEEIATGSSYKIRILTKIKKKHDFPGSPMAPSELKCIVICI